VHLCFDEKSRIPISIVALVILLFASVLSGAQEKNNSPQPSSDDQKQAVKTPPDPTIENTITAVESDESEEATRGFKHWNEFDGRRFPGGLCRFFPGSAE
jgi:hypothetical protein